MNRHASLRQLSLLAAAATLVGCSPGYNLQLSLADDVKRRLGDSQVEVHVIGVNPNDKEQLANLSLKDYWGGGSDGAAARESGEYREIRLTAAQPTQTIPAGDELWAKWASRGVTELLLITNYPGGEDRPGQQDPRRRLLPARKSAWKGDPVSVLVTGAGLRTLTPLARTSSSR